MNIHSLFAELNLSEVDLQSGDMKVISPIDGSCIANVHKDAENQIEKKLESSVAAFKEWRKVPAPKRGILIQRFSEVLRQHKKTLGILISIENGKILAEGEGEVQEMIDICDFAVGLSRQLYGLVIASERENHSLRETWHPIGPVGIISAFNFPMAVWAWNAAIALVCGNSIIWKPSEKTPLCGLACYGLLKQVINEQLGNQDVIIEGLNHIVIGDRLGGEKLVRDQRVPVISATGSCAMGQQVAPIIARRFGRSILELGGNNAAIVSDNADLDMAVRAILFGAVGTAGQRCTTTRRVFAHTDIIDELHKKLKAAYAQLKVGDPREKTTLIGPLIDQEAVDKMLATLDHLQKAGYTITGGEQIYPSFSEHSYYVTPALAKAPIGINNVKEEVFAPILHLFSYNDLDDAIFRQNDVPQGLSSSIFTLDMREAEYFLSAVGSDCGIANINTGTSGAEIGGAFGGEKATGGGRESGSDAWKGYMRRTTATVNFSKELPLAQGIEFDIAES